MDQLALQNINTLLDINEKSTFIFKDRQILINNDDSTEHISDQDGFYKICCFGLKMCF